MPFTTSTWAELRLRLQDKVEQKPFWDNAEALAAFNEGLLFYNLLTGIFRRRVTIPTIANQHEYVLPATMLYRTRFAFNNYPMSPSGREDLNLGRKNWRAETATTGGDVPTRPTMWAPISLQLVYIWPADAAGANTLTVDGVSAAPVLVEDGDTLDFGEDGVNVILGYALHALSFKKGGPAFANTLPLFKAFLLDAAEMNGLIKTTTLYRRLMGLDWRSLKRLGPSPTLMDAIIGKES